MSSGEVLISEWYGDRVNALEPDGTLWAIAGTGVNGYNGEGQVATSATIDSPAGIARADNGDILFVDNKNNCIRAIDTAGTISAVAGVCGGYGATGDGGAATDAFLSWPIGVAVDPAGGFFFTENDLGLVRHVGADGTLTTVSGQAVARRSTSDPMACRLRRSISAGRGYVVLGDDGTMYVTDMQYGIVVKIDPNGTATVVAGTGNRATRATAVPQPAPSWTSRRGSRWPPTERCMSRTVATT